MMEYEAAKDQMDIRRTIQCCRHDLIHNFPPGITIKNIISQSKKIMEENCDIDGVRWGFRRVLFISVSESANSVIRTPSS